MYFFVPVWLLVGAMANAAKPLNVVLILADDFGVMDSSPYNPHTFYDTPARLRLADTGVRFTQGYAVYAAMVEAMDLAIGKVLEAAGLPLPPTPTQNYHSRNGNGVAPSGEP